MFCLIPLNIPLHSPPCHAWICRSLHSFAGCYLCPWGAPGGPWWYCLLWNAFQPHVFCIWFCISHSCLECMRTLCSDLLLLPVLSVFLTVPWLVPVFLFCLMLAMVKAHARHLHLLNAVFRWPSSFFSSRWLEKTVLALCLRVLITLNFAERWWWLFQCKCKSVCVGLLYTDANRELSGWGITHVSRKGKSPICFSILCCELNVWVYAVDVPPGNLPSLQHLWPLKCHLYISSKFLGGYSAVLMALISNSSI